MEEEKIWTQHDGRPFKKIENANYMAKDCYGEEVLIRTLDGVKRCKGVRNSAFQPFGHYNYFFVEIKPFFRFV